MNLKWRCWCLMVCSTVFVFGQGAMQRIQRFGSNPRHLKMYVHQPQPMKEGLPVVVVLHGCSQSAKSCARLTGWNKLADENSFIVIYPEQRIWNHSGKCFNWYTLNNQTRDRGEALSIRQMVDYVVKHYRADSSRVFITGLSAGGAMTANLLAVYPDVFKAGAVFAGGPYRAATNFWNSLPAMRGWVLRRPEVLGGFVRNAYPGYKGEHPHVAVFHGRSDMVVNHRNAIEIVKQWTNVHGTDEYADSTELRFAGNKRVTRYTYTDTVGNTVVQYYSFSRMGHAVPVDPGRCPCEGGKRTLFGRNFHFYSTRYAADFFGLMKTDCPDITLRRQRCP